jgi:hypothetical protein
MSAASDRIAALRSVVLDLRAQARALHRTQQRLLLEAVALDIEGDRAERELGELERAADARELREARRYLGPTATTWTEVSS